VSVILAVAWKDLRQRLRDRSALVMGFVAPIGISLLMSLAFGNPQHFSMTAAYVDADHGPVASEFHDMLGDPQLRGLLTLHTYPTADAASAAVTDRKVNVAFVVPSGFSAAVTAATADTTVPAIRIVGGVDQGLAAQVAKSLTESFTAHLSATRLAVSTAMTAGAPASDAADLAQRAAEQQLPAALQQAAARDHELNTISYMAPGMGIFFVLFAIGFGARGYVLEGRDGTLDRIAAAPIRRGSALAGKAVATFAYALTSLATVMVVSTLAFGASWGSPLGVAALIVTMSLAVVVLTAFVMAVSRTERQAEGIASIVTFALALVGGNFTFISTAPSVLRHLALFTPNGWAMRGFTDLGTGAGIGAVGRPVLSILAFTVALGAVTAAIARRRELA
jgi:linearmycin/streptolysin S transport system permease protein